MSLSREEATIREGSVLPFRFRIMKEDKHGTKSYVRLDEISTLVLDLFLTDGTAINSRSNQNVKNANNVTISTLGEVVWTIQAADNTIQGTLDDGEYETHIAMFVWTLTDGTVGSFRQSFYIECDSKV